VKTRGTVVLEDHHIESQPEPTKPNIPQTPEFENYINSFWRFEQNHPKPLGREMDPKPPPKPNFLAGRLACTD
jgi:hypothetical protein